MSEEKPKKVSVTTMYMTPELVQRLEAATQRLRLEYGLPTLSRSAVIQKLLVQALDNLESTP